MRISVRRCCIYDNKKSPGAELAPIYILHSASMTRAWVIKEYCHILFWCIQLKAAEKKGQTFS